MKHKPTRRIVCLLVAALSLAARARETYFFESFSHYSSLAPNCSDGLGIALSNDPIWSQTSAANCAAKTGGLLFRDFQPEKAPGVQQFDVRFRFRFNADDRKRLRLVVRGRQGEQTHDMRVDITAERVVVEGREFNPPFRAEGALPTPLIRGQWNDCILALRGNKMQWFLSANRTFEPVLEQTVPELSLVGINFEVFQDAPFSLTQIEVRDPAPRPDYGVARLLPAPRSDADDGFVKGGEHLVPPNDICGATIRLGEAPNPADLELVWDDETVTKVTFGIVAARGKRRELRDGKVHMEEVDLADAAIRVQGLRGGRDVLSLHVRPLLRRYRSSYSYTDAYHDIVREWDKLPAASRHPLKLEARQTADGTELYLDGSLAATYSGKRLQSMKVTLSDAAAMGGIVSRQAEYDDSRYLPLDIAALGMAKAFATAKPSLNEGFSEVNGIPVRVASGQGSGDVGLVRQGQGNWALEVDEYSARSPFDGLLTELHFAVPGGVPYTRAWVLCAVDPDPAKDPVLTTRLAYYEENGSGNNRIADTTIRLPRGDEQPGTGVVPVGTVGHQGRQLPLYLVEVPVKSGEILDLVMDRERLNFEFIGKLWENFEQIDNSTKPDPDSTSAVQIFGVTLEKSPVGLDWTQARPANVFVEGETPETTALLTSFAPAAGRLVWDIVDLDGRRVGGGETPYRFRADGETNRVTVPLQTPTLGWFGLLARLEDADGRVLFQHPSAFARLGSDRRQAHLDSPFGIWWFDGAHRTPSDLDFAGPVMEKAGIRAVAWTGKKAEDLARYRLFKDQVNMPFSFRDFSSPDELASEASRPGEKTAQLYARARERMDKALADHPHLREVLMFHESGPGNDVPVELFGLEYKPSAERIKYEKRYADLVNLAGAFFRREYPNLKTVLGNNSCSAANVAAVLRHGGKPEYIDYIGIEAPSQVYVPEKLQEWALQGQHIARDTAETLSGRRIPATGCYEFTYRCERDMGARQQAEWYARDVLIGLANGFTRVGPGILFDAQNAYYNGLWGGSGLLRRGPTGYPKPAYVAYAVLTAVLDQAAFSRQLPTGSSTLYAVEFKRADGLTATALWAVRGTAVFQVVFGAETEVEVVEMLGHRQVRATQDGQLSVVAGTSPAYLLSRRPATRVIVADRDFPKDRRRAESSQVVTSLENADDVDLVEDRRLETPLEPRLQLPVRTLGAFEVQTVEDPQRGACIELTLKTDTQPDLSKYMTEYAVIRLKNPVEVAGRPVGFGAWVKGNSNWGRILFEIEDAQGEVWRSIGTAGWGCDILDWPGNAAVNFDGWNFVTLPLTDSSLFNDHSPGPVLEQWVSGGGDKKIDFPVKIAGLIVEMNRRALELVDFVEPTPSIRIREVSALVEPRPES